MARQLYPKHDGLGGLEAEGSISLFWLLPDGDVTTQGLTHWTEQIRSALESICCDLDHMITMPGRTTYQAHLHPSVSVRLLSEETQDGQGIQADISFVLENIWDVESCTQMIIRLGAWRDAIRKYCLAVAEWIKFLIEEAAPWQHGLPYELSVGCKFNEFFPTDDAVRILARWDNKSVKAVEIETYVDGGKDVAA